MRASKKVEEAMDIFDELSLEVDILNGQAFLLWDSMANGISPTDEDLYGVCAFDLYRKAEAVNKKFNEAYKLLLKGQREAKA